jgi:MFS family permease
MEDVMRTAEGTRWMKLVAAWRAGLLAHRDFRLMWLSSTVTSFGGQITMLALPLTAVILLDATPAQMGLLVACETLPFTLFSLHAGVLIDRMRKRPIMLVGEVVIGGALLMIPASALIDRLSMPLLYCVGFVLGIAFVVVGSASQVYLTQIAGRERLIAANSLFIASESTARLTGPGLAGLLIQWLSAPIAILFDCLTFVTSLLFLTRMRHVEKMPPKKEGARVSHEIREGLALVLGHPILRPLTLVSSSWFIVFQGWGALQTLYATRELGLSAGELGAAHMIGGAGALLSSLMARHITKRLGTGVPILIGVGCSASAWLVVAVIPHTSYALASLGAALFLFDFGTTQYWINYASLRQAVTPDGMLGRMTATMRFFTVAAAPVGALVAGHAAEAFGLRPTFAAMGVLVVGMAALLYFRTELRHVPDVSQLKAARGSSEEPVVTSSATASLIALE